MSYFSEPLPHFLFPPIVAKIAGMVWERKPQISTEKSDFKVVAFEISVELQWMGKFIFELFFGSSHTQIIPEAPMPVATFQLKQLK